MHLYVIHLYSIHLELEFERDLKFLPEGGTGKIQLNVLQMRKVNFSQVGEALKERSWLGGGCRNHL